MSISFVLYSLGVALMDGKATATHNHEGGISHASGEVTLISLLETLPVDVVYFPWTSGGNDPISLISIVEWMKSCSKSPMEHRLSEILQFSSDFRLATSIVFAIS